MSNAVAPQSPQTLVPLNAAAAAGFGARLAAMPAKSLLGLASAWRCCWRWRWR